MLRKCNRPNCFADIEQGDECDRKDCPNVKGRLGFVKFEAIKDDFGPTICLIEIGRLNATIWFKSKPHKPPAIQPERPISGG